MSATVYSKRIVLPAGELPQQPGAYYSVSIPAQGYAELRDFNVHHNKAGRLILTLEARRSREPLDYISRARALKEKLATGRVHSPWLLDNVKPDSPEALDYSMLPGYGEFVVIVGVSAYRVGNERMVFENRRPGDPEAVSRFTVKDKEYEVYIVKRP